MKILLVDDDDALMTVFSTALRKHGYDVITAANGQQGLDKAKSDKPDLIFLDQVLPDIQGNEVLKTLKEDLETKQIPVAMLSNFCQNELIQDAINTGAVDYILKYQIEPDDLDTKIKELTKPNPADSDTQLPL